MTVPSELPTRLSAAQSTFVASANMDTQSSIIAPRHTSGDDLLSELQSAPNALGRLIAAYPGRRAAEGTSWLDTWFHREANEVYRRLRLSLASTDANGGAEDVADESAPLIPTATLNSLVSAPGPAAAREVRLLSVQPHYFHGFRRLDFPIQVGGVR
jgi:hypothetical protein